MPGMTLWVPKATCSFSANMLSTFLSRVSRAMTRTGSTSSGMILVASSTSKSNSSANASSKTWTPRSHWGRSPLSIAAWRSRRWKSGSAPLILSASFHTTDCRPWRGFQWNFTNVSSPSAFTKR